MKKTWIMTVLLLSVSLLQAQDSVKVYFNYGSADILPEGQQTLSEFVKTIEPADKVYIDGYTDYISSSSFNLKLSKRRALSVKRYLLQLNPHLRIVHCKGNGKYVNKTDADGSGDPKMRFVRVVVKRAASTTNTAATDKNTDVKQADDASGTKVRLVKMFTTTAFLEKGDNVVLDNMNFHPGTAKFLDSATPTLEKLYETLRDKPALKIEIQGHICCYPSSVKHDPLALERAKAVYDYLISKGIDSTRLSYTDFGASRKLVSPERTEADRIKNRRVEIKIIDN